jgi:hypothetical protein
MQFELVCQSCVLYFLLLVLLPDDLHLVVLSGLLHGYVEAVGFIFPLSVFHPVASIGEQSGIELPLGLPFVEHSPLETNRSVQGLLLVKFVLLGPLCFNRAIYIFCILIGI